MDLMLFAGKGVLSSLGSGSQTITLFNKRGKETGTLSFNLQQMGAGGATGTYTTGTGAGGYGTTADTYASGTDASGNKYSTGGYGTTTDARAVGTGMTGSGTGLEGSEARVAREGTGGSVGGYTGQGGNVDTSTYDTNTETLKTASGGTGYKTTTVATETVRSCETGY
jgi:hypothetical protein